MDIVKIIGLGLIALLIIIILKQYKPEFAVYVSLIAGVLIFFMVLDKLSGIVSILTTLSNKTNINSQYIQILLKITGIAILTEFAVSICKDSGEAAIASKIDLGGKVIIISISIPIIVALLEVIIKIL
ncbi:MAG: stage III sporulation protein AD [Clostridia bacterium]|nr:stage III sporulation protein AD [Clostridia bacterium]